MGTSTNQRSPRLPRWDAVAATYRNDTLSVERVVQEVWRAASLQNDLNWAELVVAPAVSTCLRAAVNSSTAAEAATMATRDIFRLRQASFVAELAKRAAVQSFEADNRAQ